MCRKKIMLYQVMVAFFVATILFGGAVFEEAEVRGNMILRCDGDDFVFKGMKFSAADDWNKGKAKFLLRIVGAYPNQQFQFTPIHSVVLFARSEEDAPKILTKAGQVIMCEIRFRPYEESD